MMPPEELIAAVAVRYLRRLLEEEPVGTLRVCIVGLGPELTSAIARAAATANDLDALEIKIPAALAVADLDRRLVSSETAVHWRHSKPTDPRKRAILLAIGGDELQKSQGSIASMQRFDTHTLRRLRDDWRDASGLSGHLSSEESKDFATLLDAIDRARLAQTVVIFAAFIARVAETVRSGTCCSLAEAANAALPALRLPRGATVFDPVAAPAGDGAAELARALRGRAEAFRPLLRRCTERGEPLPQDELLGRLKGLQDNGAIEPETAAVVARFLSDSTITSETWTDSQAALAELEWQHIAPVFTGWERSRSSSLGDETMTFFDAEFPDTLDDEERRLLGRVRANSKVSPEISDFFHAHRTEISQTRETPQHRQLAPKWEKLLFSQPEVCHDFLHGLLATMQRVVERAERVPHEPVFVVELTGAERESFWRDDHHARLGQYFRVRYHGIWKAFGEAVLFRLGRMQTKPLADIDGRCTSSTKRCTELKLEMSWMSRRELDDLTAKRRAPTAQFIWTLSADTVALSLVEDLRALTGGDDVPLACAKVAREPVGAKGEIQQIDLRRSTTLRDMCDGSAGRLVNPNAGGDLYPVMAAAIDHLEADGVLDGAHAARVRGGLSHFRAAYARALKAWVDPMGDGVASPAFLEQAEAYGAVLESLQNLASRDRCRSELWRPFLAIGIASVRTGDRAAIVAPWHPLKLAEIAAKVRQAAAVAERLARCGEDDLRGADLFFEQACDNMATPYYPEVCLDGSGDRPIILALTSCYADYCLMEPPTRAGEGARQRDTRGEAMAEEAVAAARQFATVSEQYLELQPHARAGFSVVLYNPEAGVLPGALAEELGRRVEGDADLRCHLLVSHDDPARTRRIYEQQNAAIGDDAEAVLSSESSRNFLSRLRVGFAELGQLGRSDGRPPADIVFLHDVVARSAELDWMPSPFQEAADLATHTPPQWSRRRPVARGDQTAAVYLACPLQPQAGQSYLNALETMARGRPETRPGLPVRRVRFQDTGIGRILDRAHEIGTWVACYDALADRRLYRDRGIKIIRYVNDRTTHRGLIVSTMAQSPLLLAVLQQCLANILLHVRPDDCRQAAERFSAQAAELSGKIVMRAARQCCFAGELMGVVLSMMQVRALLRAANDRHIGWFFLDDFATWFGQREGQIADILAVNPSVDPRGQPLLNLVVTESKFVGPDAYRQGARKSGSQLIETVQRVARAIDPRRDRVDRKVWLERLADLMLEGMEPFDDVPVAGWDLNRWSREIRQDHVSVSLLGLSHIFVHEADAGIASRIESIRPDVTHCMQEVFAFDAVRRLVEAVANGTRVALSDRERNERWEAALLSEPRSTAAEPPREDDAGSPGPGPRSERDEQRRAPGQYAEGGRRPASERATGEAEHGGVESDRWPEPVRRWLARANTEPLDDSHRAWLDDTVKRLQKALRSYHMTSEVLGSRLTPNAALVRFRGTDELTVQKLERRRQELLTSRALDVINISGAPGEVAVMVRRPQRAILHLRELWRQRPLVETAPRFNTSLLLGAKETDGELLYLNVGPAFAGQPQHAPHTLIAGETGSGKGVLVQNLLLDICSTNDPAAARIRMIDPKAGVDYQWLCRMPHLDGGLVTAREAAVESFTWLVDEMERRYALFQEARVSKLEQFNCAVRPHQRLPFIWLFHDEMADWMVLADYRRAIETSVTRLSAKARAAGISIVLVTQRPDKDAVPPLVRANIANRLVLKVSDRRNSELVLDDPVAASLLGKGQLAAKLSGENDIKLAQVPFADQEEMGVLVDAVVASWPADGASEA
ncbi:MAG: DNA translocase FtsK [Candidatus Schekmanbacteria bacterium]|nr:DNA translocase FtsK [Candidatus Schekmanbacteria bacterium]